MVEHHLPVFSSNVLGVLGLLMISTKWLSTRGIYFDVSGPEKIKTRQVIIGVIGVQRSHCRRWDHGAGE